MKKFPKGFDGSAAACEAVMQVLAPILDKVPQGVKLIEAFSEKMDWDDEDSAAICAVLDALARRRYVRCENPEETAGYRFWTLTETGKRFLPEEEPIPARPRPRPTPQNEVRKKSRKRTSAPRTPVPAAEKRVRSGRARMNPTYRAAHAFYADDANRRRFLAALYKIIGSESGLSRRMGARLTAAAGLSPDAYYLTGCYRAAVQRGDLEKEGYGSGSRYRLTRQALELIGEG